MVVLVAELPVVSQIVAEVIVQMDRAFVFFWGAILVDFVSVNSKKDSKIGEKTMKNTFLSITKQLAGLSFNRQRVIIISTIALVSGIIVYAQIPANNVISACYNRNSGILRLIDPTVDQCDNRAEIPVSWNQTGPQGPQGIPGPGGPKAMMFVRADRTIIRCYNGMTGATTGNCGFSFLPTVNAGIYEIDLGFNVTNSFFSVTASGVISSGPVIGKVYGLPANNPNVVVVRLFNTVTHEDAPQDFYLIVY
jgi:hypothetical protein